MTALATTLSDIDSISNTNSSTRSTISSDDYPTGASVRVAGRAGAGKLISALVLNYAKYAGERFNTEPPLPEDTLLTAATWRVLVLDQTGTEAVRDDRNKADTALLLLAAGNLVSPWLSSVIDTVMQLTRFEEGWNNADGQPVSLRDALCGIRLLGELSDVISERPFLYPSAGGGVVFEFDREDQRITLLLEDSLAMLGLGHGEAPQSFDLSSPDEAASLNQVLSEELATTN